MITQAVVSAEPSSNIQLDVAERHGTRLRIMSMAVEQSPESIVITDLDGRIEYVNAAFTRNSGYTFSEAVGQNPRILNSGRTPTDVIANLWTTLLQGRVWEGMFHNKRKDGAEYIEAATVSPVRDSEGNVTHYVAVKQNITEKLQTEAEVFRLAYYDDVTGLPNRSLLMDRLGQMLAVARRQQGLNALLLLNLDSFKTINNARGVDVGDALLRAVGNRLSGLLRAGDTLARLAADEFSILLPNLNGHVDAATRHAMSVSEKIHEALKQAFRIDGDEILAGASLGVVIFPIATNDTAQELLRCAGTALYRAKQGGGNQTAFFDTEMGNAVCQRYQVELELHQAISAGELRLYLQPQVTSSQQWVGAEALLRWQHPVRGLLPPAYFIPLAEESDLIVALETWVLAAVCKLLKKLDVMGRPLRLSVNISPRHFRCKDFVRRLENLLAANGTDPAHLTLEVTESLMIKDMADTVTKMQELSALGIHFSLDDFGTGYSSLSHLKRLPIHELKIDKSFIQDAPENASDAALVESILAVARHMCLRVVAEGVETSSHEQYLEPYGQVIRQGYLYGRPEPADECLERWLSRV